MIGILVLAAYLVGAVAGWRVGYVAGYEAARKRWRSLSETTWHGDGVMVGLFTAAFWPVALPLRLVGSHLTPTPPSVKADANKQLLREQADIIARLEREAGIR